MTQADSSHEHKIFSGKCRDNQSSPDDARAVNVTIYQWYNDTCFEYEISLL
jgi:hypothetical protein